MRGSGLKREQSETVGGRRANSETAGACSTGACLKA